LRKKILNRRAPGEIRDAIVDALANTRKDATVQEIHAKVEERLGKVPASSVRSYLRLGVDCSPPRFTRVDRGRYKLARRQ
jgi:hypothetical protein